MRKKPGWKLRKAEKEMVELRHELAKMVVMARNASEARVFEEKRSEEFAKRVEYWRLEAEGRMGVLVRVVSLLHLSAEQLIALMMPAHPYSGTADTQTQERATDEQINKGSTARSAARG